MKFCCLVVSIFWQSRSQNQTKNFQHCLQPFPRGPNSNTGPWLLCKFN